MKPKDKGTFAFRSGGGLFALSALLELFGITSPIPLVGAVRGGVWVGGGVDLDWVRVVATPAFHSSDTACAVGTIAKTADEFVVMCAQKAPAVKIHAPAAGENVEI
jgi:hypothetical protein